MSSTNHGKIRPLLEVNCLGAELNERPAGLEGLRHLALWVTDLEACEHFYVGLLGLQVGWGPDPGNV